VSRDESPSTRYVLITQCLQNDFFFNTECKLCLPEAAAARLLFDAADPSDFEIKDRQRILSTASRERSPLFQFLETVVGSRINGDETSHLDLINIRDWHVPGRHYDSERTQYGSHCEAGTPGADYLTGFEQYLDPAGTGAAGSKPSKSPPWSERLAVHHIYSDTLFDFQMHDHEGTGIRKDAPLAGVINDIVTQAKGATLHVAVIGALTDIKVQLLLIALRSRYDFEQLVVSDPLTASRSVERHLTALDYAKRVLWVEVIDSVPELARFLGARPSRTAIEGHGATVEFANYSSYVEDKEGILSFEDARLRDYRRQTSEQLRRTQRTIQRASNFLVGWGMALLTIALATSVLAFLYPSYVRWQIPAITGGVGFVPLITLLFLKPGRTLQASTNADTMFRIILESRSVKVALARHHLTTAAVLKPADSVTEQLDTFERQVKILQAIDDADYTALRQLGISTTPPPTLHPHREQRN
jgi:hypothetical protein